MSTSIRDVRFRRAGGDLRARGLLGWVSATIDTLRVDNFVLRRTASGELQLFFPERKEDGGRKHAIVRPIDERAKGQIEQAVFHELRQRGELR